MAEPGAARIITKSQNNLGRDLQVIVRRARIEPWERTFQVLRQSCESEWAAVYPQHVVSQWLGHSESVSRKHYLVVSDHFYELAAGMGDQGEAQSAADCAAVGSRIGPQRAAKEQIIEGSGSAEMLGNTVKTREKQTAPPGTRTPDPLIKSLWVNSYPLMYSA